MNLLKTGIHKRERNVNFTQEETDLLVSLARAKKHIIENKKSDATTWQDKEKAWKDIETAFNSSSSSVFRDHKHLKIKYEAIKRDIRRKSAVIRAQRYQTGDGTSTAPVFTPAELKLKEIVLQPVDENDSSLDSDLVLPCTSTSGSKVPYMPAEEHNIQPASEQTLKDDLDFSNVIVEIKEQDSESPGQKVYEVSKDGEALQCKSEEKRPFDKLTEEKIEIAKIKKQILTEELEQKLIQRKILEREIEHKDIIHELEKQHLLLKIGILKKYLGEK